MIAASRNKTKLMQRHNAKVKSLISILIIIPGALLWIVLKNNQNEEAAPRAVRNSISKVPNDPPGPASQNVSELIFRKSIDPRYVTPHGSRGFSITRTGHLRPNGDALQFVESRLASSNNGDSTATYEIFLATLDCKRSYEKKASDSETTARHAKKLEQCESLLSDESISDRDWLTIAAKQGSVEAMVMYALNPEYTIPGGTQRYLKDPQAVQSWREHSKNYLEQAAAMGSQDAVLSLSNAYGAGVIVDADPTTQLAYALAAQKISPIYGFQEAYDPLKKSLTPKQLAQAEKMSDEIYRASDSLSAKPIPAGRSPEPRR